MNRPVILDFDRSAGRMDNALTVDLGAWQEQIRYASRWRFFNSVARVIDQKLPLRHGPVFLGSGDYHHISHLLVSRLRRRLAGRRLTVVVIDNHPDNMRYPFGIHCGSWVSHTAALPFVEHVHVVGITSPDIALAHAVENRLTPLFRSRLTYWSTGVDVGWARRIGLKHAFPDFRNIEDLVSTFISEQYHRRQPVYLSIDKDALSPACARTNWDQGRMELRHISDLIVALGRRLEGCDITGEVSSYVYASRWKRIMSCLDGQKPVSSSDLLCWQRQHHALNLDLLKLLSRFQAQDGAAGENS